MSVARKVVGRIIITAGVAFCYLGDWLCRAGAWLADINWEVLGDK